MRRQTRWPIVASSPSETKLKKREYSGGGGQAVAYLGRFCFNRQSSQIVLESAQASICAENTSDEPSGSSTSTERGRTYSRLRHLVNATYGPHDPREVPVVALTAYFDGSWTDKPNKPPWVMAVGGFIASEERWLWFEDKWAKLLTHFGLKYFQMREFTSCIGQFAGWKEREPDRREFIRRATRLISKTAWQSVAAAVLKNDWDFCNEGYALDENRLSPYPLCGLACIQHVQVWCLNRKRPYPLEQVLYFFEKDDPNQDDLRKRAETDYKIEIQTPKAIPDDPKVRPLGALQAADFAVWHFRNIVRKKETGELDELDDYRKDFKLLFSRVPTYPHHVHFSMKIYPHRSSDDKPELASIRNESDSDEASLVRFCQDNKVPLRPGMTLWKKKLEISQ
jgi:hypothetical protein